MKYDFEAIGKRISSERENFSEKKLTQFELGEKLGYNAKTVRKWEQGKTLPELTTMLQMCEMFGCELGYLLGEYNTRTRAAADIQSATGLRESAIKKLATYQAEKPEVIGELKGENETVIPISYFINYGEQLFQMMRAERTNHFEYLKATQDKLFPLFQKLYNKASTKEQKNKASTWGMNTDVEKAYTELVKVELQQQGKTAEDIQKIYQDTTGFYYDAIRLQQESLSHKSLMVYELGTIVEKYMQEG